MIIKRPLGFFFKEIIKVRFDLLTNQRIGFPGQGFVLFYLTKEQLGHLSRVLLQDPIC